MKVLQYVQNYFPQWWKQIDSKKYYLVETNDIDSYLSCRYLRHKTGVEIGGFYDFKTLYINSQIAQNKEPIYVDCDVTRGKAFGNHVTSICNYDCINLNRPIKAEAYNQKFAGSTLFTLFSLFNEDLSKYSSEFLQVLLTVDVWFKQYYNFRPQWDYWTKATQLEALTDICQQFDKQYFYDLLIKYRLNAPVQINESTGRISFDIDYDGIASDYGVLIPKPQEVFDIIRFQFTTKAGSPEQVFLDGKCVFSNALVYRNKALYSVIN